MKGKKDMNNYQKQKNEEDFNKYYNITISTNKYIERLLDNLCKMKGMNRSQCIRNLIYEDYVKNKENLQEYKENKFNV